MDLQPGLIDLFRALELDLNRAPTLAQWDAFVQVINASEIPALTERRIYASAVDDPLTPQHVQAFHREIERQVKRRTVDLETAKEDLVAANSRLAYDAHHDTLTGAYNRTYFMRVVSQKLQERSTDPDPFLAVLFIDFDGFKKINDTLGHHVGDELLIQIAQRLTDALRPTDCLARLGGDEFTILASTDERETVERIAQRIIDVFKVPVMIDGIEVNTSASVGIAIEANGDYSSADHMLREADAAMYRAKRKGKGRYQLFDSALRVEYIERRESEREFDSALTNNELFVVFQPLIDIESKKIVSAEAFVRWRHPSKPGLFT